jgi:hypothetical protein
MTSQMAEDDLDAALAILDGKLAELDEKDPTESPTAGPSDGSDERRAEILRQAMALAQSMQGRAPDQDPDDDIDLESLDLEWRFSAPSTRS